MSSERATDGVELRQICLNVYIHVELVLAWLDRKIFFTKFCKSFIVSHIIRCTASITYFWQTSNHNILFVPGDILICAMKLQLKVGGSNFTSTDISIRIVIWGNRSTSVVIRTNVMLCRWFDFQVAYFSYNSWQRSVHICKFFVNFVSWPPYSRGRVPINEL